MYPSGELNALATRKAMLQARIAVRRWQCAAAAREVARPLAWVDRGVETWRRFSPLVKVLALPAGALFARWLKPKQSAASAAPKGGKFAAVMAALPVVLQGVKIFQGIREARRSSAPAGAKSEAEPASPERERADSYA